MSQVIWLRIVLGDVKQEQSITTTIHHDKNSTDAMIKTYCLMDALNT